MTVGMTPAEAAALVEDYEFMRAAGEHLDNIARRLGTNRDTMQKRLTKARRILARDTDTDSVESARQAS